MGATRISESILYQRAVERQAEEDVLRTAANKLTAHITRPGSPQFRQKYDQTAHGTARPWAIKDMIELAIEANSPDEDCLAFPHALLAWTEQRLAVRDAKRESEPSLNACLTLETIEGAKQDIAVAEAFATNLSPASVQKVFDRTLRLVRKENGVLAGCRTFFATRGLRLTGDTKQW